MTNHHASPLTPLAVRTAILLAAMTLGVTTSARADYGSSFHYSNPRTGFSYDQGAVYGRGYYSSGFSYSAPYEGYGAYGTYRGGHFWRGVPYFHRSVPLRSRYIYGAHRCR